MDWHESGDDGCYLANSLCYSRDSLSQCWKETNHEIKNEKFQEQMQQVMDELREVRDEQDDE